jgi:S-adenosylmethionine decarboxylase
VEAKIDNYTGWIKGSDAKTLKTEIEEILLSSKFTILNFMEHHFQPQGYTALWLLGESHCALHTFPEEDKTYIELSSCNTQMYVDFIRIFNQHFHKTH